MFSYNNYKIHKLDGQCAFCTGDLIEEDEYIENIDGEVMHLDCADFISTSRLLEWLGVEIKEV